VTALIVVQALAIGLLGVLVIGLLRSHAEILRELHRLGVDLGDGPRGHDTASAPPVAVGAPRVKAPSRSIRPVTGVKAADITGTTPLQESVQLSVAGAHHDTLLAFLSSGCHTCAGLWRALNDVSAVDLPDRTRLIVVTKGPVEESLSRIRELAPGHVPVVMSTEAWQDYGVPVTPYFVHVDGPSGDVVGQGSGTTWPQVVSLLRQAADDDRAARGHSRRATVTERDADVDSKLLAAGIRPGDPSMYAPRSDRG
jgi:hypothetical protein